MPAKKQPKWMRKDDGDDFSVQGVYMTHHAQRRAVERGIDFEDVRKMIKSNNWTDGSLNVVRAPGCEKAITVYNVSHMPEHRRLWYCGECKQNLRMESRKNHEKWHERMNEMCKRCHRKVGVCERDRCICEECGKDLKKCSQQAHMKWHEGEAKRERRREKREKKRAAAREEREKEATGETMGSKGR